MEELLLGDDSNVNEEEAKLLSNKLKNDISSSAKKQNIPKPTPQQEELIKAKLLEFRCLVFFIEAIKKNFEPEPRAKITEICENLTKNIFTPNEFLISLQKLFGQQSWEKLLAKFNSKKLEVQTALNMKMKGQIHQVHQRPLTMDEEREKRRQLQLNLQEQARVKRELLSNPTLTPVYTNPVIPEIGKRTINPGSYPPAKRHANVSVTVRPTTSSIMHDTRPSITNSALISKRVREISYKYKIPDVNDGVIEFINLALQEKIKSTIDELVAISKKRQASTNSILSIVQTSDAKSVLRDISKREEELAKQREEEERKRLERLRASKKDDKLSKDRISRADRRKEDEKTNTTALKAIGDIQKPRRKKRKSTPTKSRISNSPSMSQDITSQNSPISNTNILNIKRITFKDVLVLIERDESKMLPLFSYRSMLGKELLKPLPQ